MKLGRSNMNPYRELRCRLWYALDCPPSIARGILSRILGLSALRASCPEMFDPAAASAAVNAAIADETAS